MLTKNRLPLWSLNIKWFGSYPTTTNKKLMPSIESGILKFPITTYVIIILYHLTDFYGSVPGIKKRKQHK